MSTHRQSGARRSPSGEQGYILITMMLFVAMLVIFGAVAARNLAFEVKRDREEELIHRGVQYSRAIRKYVKKNGRYPTRLEELENTNNLRFLRKRYKDPLTGKDFKLLHQGEVQFTFGGGIAGATPAGQNVLAPGTDPNAAAFAQRFSSLSAGNNNNTANKDAPASGDNADPNAEAPQTDTLSTQVFGGGPIVGVVSTSKDKTIREFNKKNHYNQWQFIYDPSSDRGGMLNTPNQPPLQGAGVNPAGGIPPGAAGQLPGAQPITPPTQGPTVEPQPPQ